MSGQAREGINLAPEHWLAWLRNPDAHVGMADRYLVAELWDRSLARVAALEAALQEARAHLRPQVGGRFDSRAAVAVIDSVLTGEGGG